jgi:hypothetical protein
MLVPRKLEPLVVHRKLYTKQDVETIYSNNIFSEHRTEYVRPPVVPISSKGKIKDIIEEKLVAKRLIPPPKLSLEGVVVMPGRNFAFLEGQYPRLRGDSSIEYIPLKSSQFETGDRIGQFKITEIKRDRVLLDNQDGQTIQFILKGKY